MQRGQRQLDDAVGQVQVQPERFGREASQRLEMNVLDVSEAEYEALAELLCAQ